MLSDNCETMVEEIRGARIQAKRYYGPLAYLYESYYRASDKLHEMEAEAVVHQYVSLTLPAVAFDLPKVTVTTQRTGAQRGTAEAIQQALTRWIRDSGFRDVESALALDMLFGYSVAVVTQDPVPGIEGLSSPQHRPQVRALDTHRYFQDPLAQNEREVRFRGHSCIYDKEDLIRLATEDKEAGWNLEVLKSLAVSDDLTEVRDRRRRAPTDTQRKEVVLFEVWVPEHQLEKYKKEDGYNGVIYTVAAGRDATGKNIRQYARKPRPYYGPPSGPYHVLGAYKIPGHAYPFGPLGLCSDQIRNYLDFARVVLTATKSYKRILLVNKGSDPQLTQLIKSGNHDWVYEVANFKPGDVEVVEYGGASQMMYDQLELLRENLDRSLATADSTRGTATGDATATENQLAFSSSSARLAWVKAQFAAGIANVLRTCAWYLYYDDRVVIPMKGPLTPDGQQPDAMFFGGDQSMQKNRPAIKARMMEYGVDPGEDWEKGGETDVKKVGTFADLELDVEPYSMERPGEAVQQRRITEILNLLGATVPIQPGAPWIDWHRLYDLAGRAINLPELKELINLKLLAEMTGLQIDQQVLALQTARLAGDMGGGAKPSAPRPLLTPQSGNGKGNAPRVPKEPSQSPGKSAGNTSSTNAGVSVSDQRRAGY